MSVVIGIDVGGSTTKIVGFENTIGGKRLIDPIFVRATDPITALYGAFGKFTDQNGIELSDIEIIKVTGVGSARRYSRWSAREYTETFVKPAKRSSGRRKL